MGLIVFLPFPSWQQLVGFKHGGNTSTITFGWGFVVLLALSAVVYWLALRVRLPPPVVEENVAATTTEAAQEEAELGGKA